jgi:thioredoxin 1
MAGNPLQGEKKPMAMTSEFAPTEPPRAEIDALNGPAVIEFGTGWCGYCRAAQPLIAEAFQNHGDVRHLKIEDGSGRPLGRSFRVKLWPTLVFMDNGREVARLVRPKDVSEIRDAFALIHNPLSP